MREYITVTENTCWKDCVACILEVEPVKVPDFVREYGNDYMVKTHEWLREKFWKGMVYIPSKYFMESGAMKFNVKYGPAGYSIGYLSMVNQGDINVQHHAVVCLDGAVVWDNGDERVEEYGVMEGYFMIYDLGVLSPREKIRRKKRHGKVKKV